MLWSANTTIHHDMYVKLRSQGWIIFVICSRRFDLREYEGIIDSILVGEINVAKVGKHIILQSCFIGRPRDMQMRYMEEMT